MIVQRNDGHCESLPHHSLENQVAGDQVSCDAAKEVFSLREVQKSLEFQVEREKSN
jgi:hypothetical protein